MHLSRVDLPEPLRPTIPKNSPSATSNDTSLRAWSVEWPDDSKGCRTRSLSVETWRWGRRKAFETRSTVTAGGAPVAKRAPARSAVTDTWLTLATGRTGKGAALRHNARPDAPRDPHLATRVRPRDHDRARRPGADRPHGRRGAADRLRTRLPGLA